MRHVALVPLLFGALAGFAHGQEGDAAASAQPPVFRSAASLVALNVSVSDGRHYVTGLQREEFAVFEDGVQQRIRFFESRDVPLDLVLLIDTSSSMRDRMDVVHTAASGFMGTLRQQDRGAIVTFGDVVRVAQPLTADKAELETAIRATSAYGGTALHNALYIALKQFGRGAQVAGDVRRQAFAVLSDGQDTASMLAFEDVIAQARRSGVTIYTINLRPGFEATTPSMARQFSDGEFAMRSLATETGGLAFVAERVTELPAIYSGIAEELSALYSIGYTSSNGRSDGRLRRIVVRVTSRPDLKPRTRTGYVADGVTVATFRH